MLTFLQKRRTWVAFVAVVLGTFPAHADRPTKARDNLSPRLFPMKVGHKWVYAFEDKEVAFEVLRTETVAGEELFVVRRTIGKAAVEFRLSVEEDGALADGAPDDEDLLPADLFGAE